MSFEELALKYALPVLAMGGIVMVLVGVIKIFTKMIFGKSKKPNSVEKSTLSKVMSYFYLILAMGCSAGVVCAYHAIFKLPFEWVQMLEEGLSTFACSQALYPIYRDYGGRYLLLKFFHLVCSLFKGKGKADQILEIIQKVMPLTSKQKEVLKDNLKKDL